MTKPTFTVQAIIAALNDADLSDYGAHEAAALCWKRGLHGSSWRGPDGPKAETDAERDALNTALRLRCDPQTDAALRDYHEAFLQRLRVRRAPKFPHEWRPTKEEVVRLGHVADGALNLWLRRRERAGKDGGPKGMASTPPPSPEPTLFQLGNWDLNRAGSASYKGTEFPLEHGKRKLLARLIQGKGRPVHVDDLMHAMDIRDRNSLKVQISHLCKHLRNHLPDFIQESDKPVQYRYPNSYELILP